MRLLFEFTLNIVDCGKRFGLIGISVDDGDDDDVDDNRTGENNALVKLCKRLRFVWLDDWADKIVGRCSTSSECEDKQFGQFIKRIFFFICHLCFVGFGLIVFFCFCFICV